MFVRFKDWTMASLQTSMAVEAAGSTSQYGKRSLGERSFAGGGGLLVAQPHDPEEHGRKRLRTQSTMAAASSTARHSQVVRPGERRGLSVVASLACGSSQVMIPTQPAPRLDLRTKLSQPSGSPSVQLNWMPTTHHRSSSSLLQKQTPSESRRKVMPAPSFSLPEPQFHTSPRLHARMPLISSQSQGYYSGNILSSRSLPTHPNRPITPA